ncbi:MAG: hypothetical protein QW128_08880 [Thermoprotei archaeon]
MDRAEALTYNDVASSVINKLPPEWSYLLKEQNNIVQNSISDCRAKLGSMKYVVSNGSGQLVDLAVNAYNNITSYMHRNNYTSLAKSYGLLVCYVTALVNPLRLSGNTTRDLIDSYEYFVDHESFSVVVGSADSVTDVRDYLKNLAAYSYNYFNVIYSSMINVTPGSNLGFSVYNVTQVLINKAATAVYSLMIKAINDHRVEVLPLGIAWIAVGIIVGIIIVKRESIFQIIRKSKEE